ncbi:MAG TPA: hypothetical protein VFJ51_13780 [Nitrososphaeraceae archaeon]|nr:hypothetical protein [Nitrososphaeraceae archaeon]
MKERLASSTHIMSIHTIVLARLALSSTIVATVIISRLALKESCKVINESAKIKATD